jgi:hypothetical protein
MITKPISEFTESELFSLLNTVSNEIKRRNVLLGSPKTSSDPSLSIQEGLKVLVDVLGPALQEKLRKK